MKTYIAVSLTNGHNNQIDNLTDCLNRLICSPVKADIFVYNLTGKDLTNRIKSLLRAYTNFGVFTKTVKSCKGIEDIQKLTNIGISEALLGFNSIKSNKYSSFIHISQNMLFQNFDLQILANNSNLYHALSPVVNSFKGIEVLKACFDRYGVEYYSMDESTTHFITGEVEETFALNPKCFAMSKSYANKLRNFYYSADNSIHYLNDLITNFGNTTPKVDTNIFVHENLY